MNKILSLSIAIFYLIFTFLKHQDLFLAVLVLSSIGLIFIWFSEVIGSYTGFSLRHFAINQESPPSIIAFFGWVILLLPIIIKILGL